MPSDHPQTPQSPSTSSFTASDNPVKTATSPQITHSLPTPAHSINGSMSSVADAGMEMSHEDSNKRKREIEDHGDRDSKKIHIEASRLSINDLHLDVGEKYLLCKSPHTPAAVPVMDDLFARYGLEDIAQSVARYNPDGSKGVKLRKTYKNHMKEYGLAGAFNPVKKEAEDNTTLSAMLNFPEAEWDSQVVQGKDIQWGIPAASLANMGKALTMARGTIPKNEWNNSVLSMVEPANTAASQVGKTMQNGNRTPLHNAPVARAAKAEPPRPRRNVKKRTYGDSSYEGYGEGYVDDDSQDIGYSTGDGDDRGSRKRPKKTAQNSFQNGNPMRQNSYGPGMVGA